MVTVSTPASPSAARISVLVVDNSRIHAQLLTEALQRDPTLLALAAPPSLTDILGETRRQNVDIAVISASLGNDQARGFDVLRELRAAHFAIRGIMLLDSLDRETVLEAFRAGARGIFSRSDSIEALCKCVRRVSEGQIWASADQMAYAVEALATSPTVRATDAKGFSLLTARELEVVKCLAEGMTNREIAEQIGLSQHTIKNYVFRIFEKLGVSTRVELLFMTLSQAGSPVARASAKVPGNGREKASTVAEGATDKDLPLSHILLARKCRDGEGVPRDLVSAYMWYLVCEESSVRLKDEVATERRALVSLLDSTQISIAQKKASDYLKTASKIPPRGSGEGPKHVVS